MSNLPMGQHIVDDRSAEREDREAYGIFSHKNKSGDPVYRNPWGSPAKAAFRVWLPEGPKGACSRAQAGAYAQAVGDVLDHHSEELTRSEQSYLYRLRKHWQRRADGLDPRFEALGGAFPGIREDYRRATAGSVLAEIRKMVKDNTHPRPLELGTDAERYTCIYPEKPPKPVKAKAPKPAKPRNLYDETRKVARGIGQLGPRTKQGVSHSERIRRILSR